MCIRDRRGRIDSGARDLIAELADHERTLLAGAADVYKRQSYLCVAANALELGTLVMGRYDEAKIKEILDLPENYDVSCICLLYTSR